MNSEMSYLACDKSKVWRAQQDLMAASTILDENTFLEDFQGLFFDGKIDKTKVIELNKETKRYHQSIIKEEHTTLTQEP